MAIPLAGDSIETQMQGQFRRRGPLSCQECSRRKIKCNKKMPCRACTERGEAALCRQRPTLLDNQSRTKSNSTVPLAVQSELDKLYERLGRVESAIGLQRDTLSSQQTDTPQFKENGLAGAMEEAALGIGEKRRWQGSSLLLADGKPPKSGSRWYSPIPFSTCIAAFPRRHESQQLLTWYCMCLDWLCACLHQPTLVQQHDNFWSNYDQNKPQDGMVLALLFAVLSVSAFFLDEEEARSKGFDPQDLRQRANLWFDCSIATFFRCDGLIGPSLAACQTILTLNHAFHLSENTHIHVSMGSLLVGMARTMNLHLLGNSKAHSQNDILRHELGRRVWWHIVEAEWYFLPYHRYTSIASHQFNTALPDLADDGSFASGNVGMHSLTFLLTCCRSSEILYKLYGHLQPNQNPPYVAVLSAAVELGQISHDLPSDLQQAMQSTATPSGLVNAGRIMGMLLAYRTYLIHRSYFVESLDDPAYQQSYSACIQASETILDLSERGLQPTFYRLWTTTLWLVAAGIVLSLDLVHAATEKRISWDISSRRKRLDDLERLLNTRADTSGIGARGGKLIRYLRVIEDRISVGQLSTVNITRKTIIDLVASSDGGLHVSLNQPEPARCVASEQEAWLRPSSQTHFNDSDMSCMTSSNMMEPLADNTNSFYFEPSNNSYFTLSWADSGSLPDPSGDLLEPFGGNLELGQVSNFLESVFTNLNSDEQ